MNRRGLLGGLIAALATPAIIRTPGLLMAVKPLPAALTEESLLNALVELNMIRGGLKVSDYLTSPSYWWMGPDGLIHYKSIPFAEIAA